MYACTRVDGLCLYMHRVIMDATPGAIVDHVDMDGLNNTRSNLRVATKAENMSNRGRQRNNRSGHKGVSWNKSSNKWLVQICANKVRRTIGTYSDLEEARLAYARAAAEFHGKFSRTA